MPDYISKMKPNGATGPEYNIKDAEVREVVTQIQNNTAGTQTVTGNPITLTDASETYAQELSVELEPIQDLHGYDHPWVGGTGKNKLPMTVDGIKAYNTFETWSGNSYTLNGVTFTILTDNTNNVIGIKVNGTASIKSVFAISKVLYLPNNTYRISGCPSGGSPSTYRIADTYTGYFADYGDGTSFTSAGGRIDCVIEIGSGYTADNLIFYPMIRLSTETDPTFAPYSNICPITGYTECDVDDVGKNLWAGGNISETLRKVFDVDYPADIYSLSLVYAANDTASNQSLVTIWYSDGTSASYLFNRNTRDSWSFIATKRITKIYFYASNNYVNSETKTFTVSDIQFEKSATPTEYEPYHSSNATIQFGQMVYGGKSDFTEGGTDDEWNKYDVWDTTWYKSSTEATILSKSISDKKSGVNEIKCNAYKYEVNEGFNLSYGAISNSGVAVYRQAVFIRDTRFAGKTVEECVAILNSEGTYFVYQLETPENISTPPTELKLLQDTNHLTTNGTTINLDYIPNNSIGDAVEASEDYTDRVAEMVRHDLNALGLTIQNGKICQVYLKET